MNEELNINEELKMNEEFDKFFLVFNRSGRSSPMVRKTQIQAENEALRLAEENPSHTFYILETLYKATTCVAKISKI